MKLDQFDVVRHDHLEEIFSFFENLRVVDQHFIHLRGEVITNRTDHQVGFFVYEGRGLGFLLKLFDALKESNQIAIIPFQLFASLVKGGCAHDVANTLGKIERAHGFFQLFALCVAFGLARHPPCLAAGHKNHVASGEG